MARLVKHTEKVLTSLKWVRKPTLYVSVGFLRTNPFAMDLIKGQRTKRRGSFTYTTKKIGLKYKNLLSG